MRKEKNFRVKNERGSFTLLTIVFSLSLIAFIAAFFLKDFFESITGEDTYLAWHNLLEFCSAQVCFAVFFVSFYSYERTKNLRTMFWGSILLSVGVLEIFHALSFKGMPVFFMANRDANRATTLWILSRLVFSIGFLIISFISLERKSSINKWIYTLIAVVLSLGLFFIVTSYPWLLPKMYIEGVGLTQVKKDLEFFVMILFGVAIIRFHRLYQRNSDPLLLQLCASLVLNIFCEIAFINYGSVYDVYNFAGHLYKAVSYLFLFNVMFIRNVQQPYVELSATQQELHDYIGNLDKIVDQRTRQIKQINRKLIDDLEYARDIQKAMLPAVLPDVKGISFNTFYYPAERLSGDFYDIYRIDERYIGMYICDVSGHGVPAAMLTVFLKQCIETRQEADINNGKVSMPSTVLQNVYESFNNTNFKDDVYIVLVYALLDTLSLEMTYSSAGMNVAPILLKSDGTIEELFINGFPVCKFKGLYDVKYHDTTIRLDRGDRILFYTDGLVEGENSLGEQFSAERLTGLLEENRRESGERLSAVIHEGLFRFIDSIRIKDDITFYIMDIQEL